MRFCDIKKAHTAIRGVGTALSAEADKAGGCSGQLEELTHGFLDVRMQEDGDVWVTIVTGARTGNVQVVSLADVAALLGGVAAVVAEEPLAGFVGSARKTESAAESLGRHDDLPARPFVAGLAHFPFHHPAVKLAVAVRRNGELRGAAGDHEGLGIDAQFL